jgi:hypothetical protein
MDMQGNVQGECEGIAIDWEGIEVEEARIPNPSIFVIGRRRAWWQRS